MINNKRQRICDNCGAVMTEGYMIEDGVEHYCSDECLHEHYTQEEYLEMYDNGEGSTCWTEWYDEIGMKNSGITKYENI